MRKWIIRIAVVVVVLFAAFAVVAWQLAKRFEPFVREQAVRYIEQRFNSTADLKSLRVSVPLKTPWRLATAPLRVTGEELVLHFRSRTDLPPLIKVKKFEVESSLGSLWSDQRQVRQVKLAGLEINVPPKRERRATPASRTPSEPPPEPASPDEKKPDARVLVRVIHAKDTIFRMYPDDPARPPRVMEIHDLRLTGAGTGVPLQYTANLTNPKPTGTIQAKGEFGPWNGEDPGLTPVSGKYEFKDADLGTINGIAGILQSTGEYTGVLRRIEVNGETRTPDFRLKLSGNPVPLTTKFHSIVDGTTGDTLLQPVEATLGRTRFTCRGGVIRKPGAKARQVSLDVVMNGGHMADLLRLAMKGKAPIIEGAINMRTKLEILPKQIAVVEKLTLDGTFDMSETSFASAGIQDKIDSFSRRAQGQPKNEQIADVLSAIRGAFTMRDGIIRFSNLKFSIPGAAIELKGLYGLYSEEIDFRGTARLRAKVSQTMSGWKRWALKPVDPFFSKDGAGTLLNIKVTGTRDKPSFGLDRGDKEQKEAGQKEKKTAWFLLQNADVL